MSSSILVTNVASRTGRRWTIRCRIIFLDSTPSMSLVGEFKGGSFLHTMVRASQWAASKEEEHASKPRQQNQVKH